MHPFYLGSAFLLLTLPYGVMAGDRPAKAKESLAGTYEYIYPHNTAKLKENHYIVLKGPDSSLTGTYYGTSDEFDRGREGYLPGFFKAEMKDIVFQGDSLSFTLTVKPEEIYDEALTPQHTPKNLKRWVNAQKNPETVTYTLKRSGDDLVKDEGVLGLRKYVKKKG